MRLSSVRPIVFESLEHRLRSAERPPQAMIPGGVIERMDRVVRRVAAGNINVILLGETGVGKEVFARRIHALSPRAKMPLVALNCAALSESLLESELFGHEKGAFTGALAARQGLLESSNGGTILLDEVGEMPLGFQAKLLRVLEEREVRPVGALRPRPIDVRFVAATNRNIEQEIAEGRFRQDLYFRLNGITFTLPPLRERTHEIEPLALMFIERACRVAGRPTVRIAGAALDALKRYAWPGNVRELRNVLERAVLLSSGDTLTMEYLPVEKVGPGPTLTPVPAAVAIPSSHPPPNAASAVACTGADAEREAIVQTLEKCGGNQSKAAKLLGISRGTMIKRIDAHHLPRPRPRQRDRRD